MEIEAEIEVDETTGLVKRSAPPPYPIGPATFAALLDGPLKHFPERVALIDNERQWTFAELDRSVDQAAAALTSLGVGPGDRVAWSLANCAEVPIGFLATQRLAASLAWDQHESGSARKISPSQRLASMPVDHRERYDRRVQQHVVQRVCNQRVRIQRCGLNSRPHKRSTPKYRPPCARRDCLHLGYHRCAQGSGPQSTQSVVAWADHAGYSSTETNRPSGHATGTHNPQHD